ncbi:MAG: PKD domain-containing protein [Planctomycetes bacterium]|nr:PKD domain-containing protein [Planctomycetota bacterium]
MEAGEDRRAWLGDQVRDGGWCGEGQRPDSRGTQQWAFAERIARRRPGEALMSPSKRSRWIRWICEGHVEAPKAGEQPIGAGTIARRRARGWSILVLGGASLAGFLGTGSAARCQDVLVTEDFEDKEVGEFPSRWYDLADVVAPQEQILSTVTTAVGPYGEPTNVLEVRSLEGTTQGIYRPLAEQAVYRVNADVCFVQDMPTAAGNVAIDIAFVIRSKTDPFTSWSGAGGAGSSTWWEAYSAWPLDEVVIGASLPIGRWHRVSVDVDTTDGLVSSRVVDLTSGAEVASVSSILSNVIGRRFDTIWLASHHKGGAGREAITLFDNMTYTDPAEGLFPEGAFSIVEPSVGCALTGQAVRLDASASTTPEGSGIVSYAWDFGDGTTGEGEVVSHIYDRCGRFVIGLTVMNDRSVSSATEGSVCIIPPPPDPMALSPWTATQVGDPAVSGSAWPTGAGEAGCLAFCVGGSGCGGTSDECLVVWQSVHGDGTVALRVEDVSGGMSSAGIGVILRGSLDPAAAFVLLSIETVESGAVYRLRCRAAPGETQKRLATLKADSASGWLRLRRVGSAFTAEASLDEVEWTQVGQTLEVPSLAADGIAGAVAYARDSDLLPSCEGLRGTICALAWTAAGAPFLRGDTNADSDMNISDPVFNLNYQFARGPSPTCLKTGDVNDDGLLDLADPIFQLNYLFASGPTPPAPLTECDTDPTSDTLSCEEYAPCR